MGARTETRARMVTSAALLLREHGVHGTSITQVLEHSHGPRGSVRFHYPGAKQQLVTEADEWAGDTVTRMLTAAADRGADPVEVLSAICAHYARQLEESDFRAGCPIGAVAQDSFDHPTLAPVVRDVLQRWVDAFARVLVEAGHGKEEAAELAELTVASVEGAIILARLQRTNRPLDLVERQLGSLMAADADPEAPRP